MVSRAGGWAGLVAEILQDLTAVAVSHLRLARQEAGDQGRTALMAGAHILAGAMMAQAALLMIAAGAGLLVGRWLGEPLVGLLVAGVLLLAAGVGILMAGRRKLRGIRPLEETLEELGESRQWLENELFPRLRKNAKG
jgi:uncharacterized membrane protein YqjE